MAMKLLTIDEIHATESADPALVVGHVQILGVVIVELATLDRAG
jgi:hypothetical protein